MKKFSYITTNLGVVLCEERDGAFLCINHPEELDSLKELLSTMVISPATSPVTRNKDTNHV